MTDAAEIGGAVGNRTRRDKATVTIATGLAKHLGQSRRRIDQLTIDQLTNEKVIARQGYGRFDQDACRLRYLDWL